MQVRILGPVDVVVDGVPRPVRGLRRRAVLALLALRAGEIVSTDRLADVVWARQRPPAPNTVQTHVSALRGLLGDRAAIEVRSPGYALEAATDVREARRLIESGLLAPDPATSAARLREALTLWRDRSLADVTELPELAQEAHRLDLLRLDAVEALTEARLALGEHARLVPELEALCREHPFREGLHRQLMLALYAVGRQADALAVFEGLRRSLDEQLGVGPGPALREAHAALLRHDTRLRPAAVRVEPNRFCTTGEGVRVAYNCAGSGPPLVVPAAWIATLEMGWQDPHLRTFYATLAARHRVIRYDGPDTGLSGPWHGELSLESEVEVLRTVVDALGLQRVALLGVSKGALVALAFAASYPQRVDRLVLYGGYLDGTRITTAQAREAFVALVRENWGMGSKLLAELLLPDEDAEARERFARLQRASAPAPVAARLLTGCYELRVTDIVDRVVAPALVLHRRDDQLVPYSLGRELATVLPDARFVPLAGRSHFPHMGDARAVLDAIGSFLDLPLDNRSPAALPG
ncbi:DNA-binding transcriptional activator of the SARP family [Lentzea albidocapillata subsp. violacea]|uniref:DNA-binding transcriptional activator of the SARP family n=1 Tax=Lentzea albidocapillata subsp. violacea TaxID=128104 RepID=A0A1G8S1H7_9PSEU|nr:alpha/beta fold hydrolase [Lentzea albidocapillata]SDJ23046.1 DNA-binding transcriptional activator of the SARP family [Lentzea albidocapillata subsp. violacea]